MDFTAFDTRKLEEYKMKAKEQWGDTSAYKEYEEKASGRSDEEEKVLWKEFMKLFERFGKIKDTDPASDKAQGMVKEIQDYITEHFYDCSKDILAGLGKMYSSGGEFTTNIDSVGGSGTAEFVGKVIEIYCK